MSINRKTNVDNYAEMTERIEQVREDLGLSRLAFCKHIGFPYPRYSHITGERRSKPTVDLLQAVAAHANASLDWLLSGEGPAYKPSADGSAGGGERSEGLRGAGGLTDAYVLLPLYNVQGGAGEGTVVGAEEVEDLLAFKREWITRELRSSPDDLSLIYVRGESMVPTLSPGDVILVERNQRATVSDGIYVIRIGEALLVKRLQFLPDGELMVTSDNPAYQPFRVTLREQEADFSLIGRVVWAGRRF